ncbi:hypothetical protein QTP70_013121 [Hemibagrus guttatus]|uniref:Uncharacterized protein n=1 Tax=Hemibagrus guttatus TaxID=175788 RepID=A0AAE0R7S9_9TELE|nr:hypothetical protein QTP70_013121 [Hemibagrus guttatus]
MPSMENRKWSRIPHRNKSGASTSKKGKKGKKKKGHCKEEQTWKDVPERKKSKTGTFWGEQGEQEERKPCIPRAALGLYGLGQSFCLQRDRTVNGVTMGVELVSLAEVSERRLLRKRLSMLDNIPDSMCSIA